MRTKKNYLHLFAVDNCGNAPYELTYTMEGSGDVASVIKELAQKWGVELKNMRCFIINREMYLKLSDYLWENKNFDAYKCGFVKK